jgi:hypothetical protein
MLYFVCSLPLPEGQAGHCLRTFTAGKALFPHFDDDDDDNDDNHSASHYTPTPVFPLALLLSPVTGKNLKDTTLLEEPEENKGKHKRVTVSGMQAQS